MADLLQLRASSLPMAFRCPASVRPSAIPINGTNDAATMGTAVHHAARTLAETGRIDWDVLPAIAAKFGVDEDELRMLCAMATKLWRGVEESFRGAMTEVELVAEPFPNMKLTGHADLLAVAANAIRVGDWKFGRKDADYSQQLRGYAALALLYSPGTEEATGTILWVRDGEIENYTMNRAGLAAWLEELRATVVDWDGVYRPGKQCTFCPRAHECPARAAMVRADVATFTGLDLDLASMAPDAIVSLLHKADLVERVAGSVRAAIKEHVERTGEIVASNTVLAIEKQERRALDPLKAFPVLEAAGFGDEEFARVMTLKVSEVEKVVASKAARGKGAAAKRALDAALRKAGAVETTETKQLKEQRR